MKKKTILFLVLMLLFLALLTSFSQGQEEERTVSFLTGNGYLRLAEENKIFYVGGLTDMLLASVSLYVPELYPYLEETIRNMSGQQIKAIFDKYLEEDPKEWHCSAGSLFFAAIMNIVNENIK